MTGTDDTESPDTPAQPDLLTGIDLVRRTLEEARATAGVVFNLAQGRAQKGHA